MSAILRSLHDTEEHLPTPVSAFLAAQTHFTSLQSKKASGTEQNEWGNSRGGSGRSVGVRSTQPQPVHFHCPPYHRGSRVVEKWITTLVAERKGKKKRLKKRK